VILGAGQLYKGNFVGGLLWFLAVVVGYAAYIIPGLVLHFLCVLTAFTAGDPNKR